MNHEPCAIERSGMGGAPIGDYRSLMATQRESVIASQCHTSAGGRSFESRRNIACGGD